MFDRYIPISREIFRETETPDSPLPTPDLHHKSDIPEPSAIRDLLSHFSMADIASGDLLLLGLFVYLLNCKADEELLIAMGLLLIL